MKAWRQLSSSEYSHLYDYDAFVAYDYNDFFWIKNELLVEMEQKRKFRLCVHHRDFPAGHILEEIIVDRIHKSRKAIFLLTPNFVKSHWCAFELRMARHQLFDSGRDVIVPVILEPLPAGSVNGTLYQILKRKLYLEWVEDDEAAQELFWGKLSDAFTEEQDVE